MKLVYSHPALVWIHDFLDKDTYKNIHNSIIQGRKKIHLHSVKGVWPNEIFANQLKPPLRTEIDKQDTPATEGWVPLRKLKTLIKHNPYFALDKCKYMSTLVHYMEKGSGIDWHDDGDHKYGAIYYVNRRWNQQWGGEFMFEEGGMRFDEMGCSSGFLPLVGNSLVIVKFPVNHKVNTVLSPLMPRITVQIFMG
jgi:hypothetical protein